MLPNRTDTMIPETKLLAHHTAKLSLFALIVLLGSCALRPGRQASFSSLHKDLASAKLLQGALTDLESIRRLEPRVKDSFKQLGP